MGGTSVNSMGIALCRIGKLIMRDARSLATRRLPWSKFTLDTLWAAAPGPQSDHRVLARCKLAASAGDWAAGGSMAAALTNQIGAAQNLRAIWTVALVARRPEISERLLSTGLSESWQVSVRLIPNIFPITVVQWTVTSEQKVRFDISEQLLESDKCELYRDRWMSLLPPYKRYERRQPIETGLVPLCLDDCAGPLDIGFASAHQDAFLIPDPIFLTESAYRRFAVICRKIAPSWEQRVPRAFRRGGTTGGLAKATLH